jgi:chromosomal replication initiation ATPase DnaA
MRQLGLPFLEAASYAPEDFCTAPSNAAARAFLANPDSWTNGRLILWGEPGCGKTHLLHVWAATNHATIYEGATLSGLIRPAGPAAVDDADIAEPRPLLHLLNAATEAGLPVLMTARLPPARQPIKLADLASRLRAAASVEIRAPEDELLAQLLTRLAAERQLTLTISIRNFLLTNLPRTAAAYREAVARLDRATLENGAKMSRNLVADLLRDLTHT